MFIQSNNELRELLPNTVIEVEGEQTLYDKIRPYLNYAEQWWQREICPLSQIPDAQTDYTANNLARKALASEAMLYAVPALDMVLTANGFAVANTDQVSPASKDRVDRLLRELEEARDLTVEMFAVGRRISGRTFPDCLFAGFDFERELGITEHLLRDHQRRMAELEFIEMEIGEQVTGWQILDDVRNLRFSTNVPALYGELRAKCRELAICLYRRRQNDTDNRQGLERHIDTLKKRIVSLCKTYHAAKWEAGTAPAYWNDTTYKNNLTAGGLWV